MKRGGGLSGAVSLVMIFCVLCLSVFAVLTLSAAVREQRLSALAAERAEAYYAADAAATEWLAALSLPEGETAEASFPAGGSQTLEVAVRMEAGAFQIRRWQTVYAGEINDTISIWDGDN